MKERAERIADEAKKIAAQKLGADDVQVIIEINPKFVIPETGTGGFTPDSHKLFVYIDPDSEHLEKNLEKEIRSTVTHEYHHVIRNRTINWKADTLLGAMVTEGLADHFDLEVNGGESRPWSHALTADQLKELFEKAQPEFNSHDYNSTEWLFGSEENQLPKWGGYSLGFKIVSDYLQKSGKKASELVAERPENFI